jgi:hypothetical protein
MHLGRVHTGKIPTASPEAVSRGKKMDSFEKPKRRKYKKRMKTNGVTESNESRAERFMAEALTTERLADHLNDICNHSGAYEEVSRQGVAVISEAIRRLSKMDEPPAPTMPHCPQCGFKMQMFNAAYAIAKKHSDA